MIHFMGTNSKRMKGGDLYHKALCNNEYINSEKKEASTSIEKVDCYDCMLLVVFNKSLELKRAQYRFAELGKQQST